MIAPSRIGALLLSAALLLPACAKNELWTTPLAAPRESIDRCQVSTTTGTPAGGVDNLAAVRCRFTGAGPSCVDLARAAACKIGGNLLYGLHYEEGEYLVGTIAVTSTH